MIGFLRGTVMTVAVHYCLLDVHDVGYRVFISQRTRENLHVGTQASLYIHTHVREDAILLYGFSTQEEYELFQLLIGISGVGPKAAQGILSATTEQAFYQLVHQQDIKGIMRLPGIGKKTAERIIFELKDKLPEMTTDGAPGHTAHAAAPEEYSGALGEAVSALLGLGFQQSEIQAVLKEPMAHATTEELIRYALSQLQRF